MEKANESLDKTVAQNKELLKEIETLKQTTQEGSESNNSGDDASGDVALKALENKNTLLQQTNDKLCAENEIGGRTKLVKQKEIFLRNGSRRRSAKLIRFEEGWRRLQFKIESMGTAIGKLEEKVKLLKEELELRRAGPDAGCTR